MPGSLPLPEALFDLRARATARRKLHRVVGAQANRPHVESRRGVPYPWLMRNASTIDPQTRLALAAFEPRMRQRYGAHFAGMVLFGSRARGDHRPDSDADVAIFIDATDDPVREQMDIADDAYQVFLDTGVLVQPWVFTGRPDAPDVSPAEGLLNAVEEEGLLF
jgi:uncharacterized protein